MRRLRVSRHGDASLCLAWAGEQRCLSAPQLRSHLSLYISFACALLLHACASFMQRARAFCKFLCSGGLRSPVAEWTRVPRHRMACTCTCMRLSCETDAYRPLPSMGTHGYMHELRLLTQHVMQHHSFFVLQQKIVAGDL